MFKRFLLLSILFFNSIIGDQGFLSNQGLVQGTLVKTVTGYKAIETIKPGQFIYCAGKTGSYQQPVKAVSQCRTNSVIVIKGGDNKILCGPQHLFYLPQEGIWEQAQNLTADHVLTNFQQEHVHINSVTTLNTPAELFDLTVDKYHTFYVSEQNLVVHNFPVIFLPLALPIVSAASQGAAVVGTAALGWKIVKSFEKRKKERSYQRMEQGQESYQAQNAQPPVKPPKDPKDDTRPNNELIREIRSLTKRLNEHRQKLQEYIEDPYKCDNRGILKNAKTAENRTKIIQQRIDHLKKEIKAFKIVLLNQKKN